LSIPFFSPLSSSSLLPLFSLPLLSGSILISSLVSSSSFVLVSDRAQTLDDAHLFFGGYIGKYFKCTDPVDRVFYASRCMPCSLLLSPNCKCCSIRNCACC
jgi:hypothetical protein